MIALPYGRVPYPLDLGDRRVEIVESPTPPVPGALAALLDDALATPIGRPCVEAMVRPGDRVTVIVSDRTRSEPRAEFLAALRRRLPAVRWTVAIATGTHGPSGVAGLDLPADLDATIIDHDGHAERDLVSLGVTTRGTPMRVHRCVVDADLVVATGCIRPHYFAGFGAGVKALFPGLGAAHGIRINHRLKTAPGARAGHVEDNPCRLDLEEAAGMVPTPTFLLNGVCATDGAVHAVVAGNPLAAFRAGVALARPWFTVAAQPAPIVVASDGLPVSATLYQAAKIAAAVTSLVLPGGLLVVVAECADGTGPLETVNEAILRTGVLPRLAPDIAVCLVSSLDASLVRKTLVTPSASVLDAIGARRGHALVIPHASQLLFESL